jgi:transposase
MAKSPKTTTATAVNHRKVISDIDFCRAYNAAQSVKEVQTALGVSYGNILTRAKSYKAKGVALKSFPPAPRGRRIDVEALNKMLKVKVG